MKKYYFKLLQACIFVALLITVVLQCEKLQEQDKPQVVIKTHTVFVKDTVPVLRDSVILRYERVKLPVVNNYTTKENTAQDTLSLALNSQGEVDSVEVEIPIEQKVYSDDSTYTAYVSGYRASLDSITITQKYTTIFQVKEKAKKQKISIGIQGGYGYTPKGFLPYIGLGVSLNFL